MIIIIMIIILTWFWISQLWADNFGIICSPLIVTDISPCSIDAHLNIPFIITRPSNKTKHCLVCKVLYHTKVYCCFLLSIVKKNYVAFWTHWNKPSHTVLNKMRSCMNLWLMNTLKYLYWIWNKTSIGTCWYCLVYQSVHH